MALSMALVAGCGGGAEPGASFDDDGEPAGSEAEEAVEEAAEASTMPDVVGLPVDEATAALEEAGFRVSTGVVRTTEMEPDLVYRSEPAPGRRVQEGQRVTLRIAAEPRQ
jgi:beta-lactam-binding protein with PASTA domain